MSNFAGLYIGVDFVDLVVLTIVKGNPRVMKSSRISFSEGLSLDEQMDRTSAISAAIKKAIDAIDIEIDSITFGLPQNEVMVRHFSMPYLILAERLNAVKYEAQKYLPFKIDDIVSDFYVTKEDKNAKSMDVLFAAVDKRTMDSYLALFRDLGIKKVNIIDIIPVALLRILLAAGKLSEEETFAVVYLEKDRDGTIVIVKDKEIYLAREVGTSISKTEFFESVLNNIRLSINYFKRQTKEIGINGIILCGEGDLFNLEIYLKQNISQTPVQTFYLSNEIDGLNDLSRKQLIGLGFAMASFEKPAPKINLVSHVSKAEAFQRGFNIEEYKPIIIEGAVLFIVLLALQIFCNINIGAAKGRLAQIKSQTAMIVKGAGAHLSQEALLNIESQTKTKLQFLKELVGEDRFFLTKKLSSLGRIMPQNAWVESFQFQDEIDKERSLTISGFIYSQKGDETNVLNRLLTDAKADPDFNSGFQDIKLGVLERTSAYEREMMSFSIECKGEPLKSSGMFTRGG